MQQPNKVGFFIVRRFALLVTKTINNIVACVSPEGKEQIVMGRGLGFDFKVGSEIDQDRIEKVFSIDNQSGYDNAKNLFANIPEELLNICINIIDSAKESLNSKLNDSIYLTLTDHINFAITKTREGFDLYSAILSDVKVFYPREYMIGKEAIVTIERRLGKKLPAEEACAIALHIVNAEYNTEIGSIMHITQSIADVVSIINKKIGVEIRDDDIAGASLLSYLKYFVFRIYTDNNIADNTSDRFPQMIASISPDCHMLSEAIATYLERESNHEITKMDKASLASNIYSFREYFRRKK